MEGLPASGPDASEATGTRHVAATGAAYSSKVRAGVMLTQRVPPALKEEEEEEEEGSVFRADAVN